MNGIALRTMSPEEEVASPLLISPIRLEGNLPTFTSPLTPSKLEKAKAVPPPKASRKPWKSFLPPQESSEGLPTVQPPSLLAIAGGGFPRHRASVILSGPLRPSAPF